jgi:hypothetical protein
MTRKLNKKEKDNDIRPVSQEEFDKALDACINTPPLRLKDLKARLKKEREEREKSFKERGSN